MDELFFLLAKRGTNNLAYYTKQTSFFDLKMNFNTLLKNNRT